MIEKDARGMHAIRSRAYALADTGRFMSAHAVEQALIAEGWPNATRALQSEYARKAVSERCAAVQAH